jgi:hypothetical protein
MTSAEAPSGTSWRMASKNAAQVRRRSFLSDAAGQPPSHQPHGQAGGPEEEADRAPGEDLLGGLVPDELQLVVSVHVSAGERSPDDDAVAPMVLHKRDLPRPCHAPDRVWSARVCLLRALGMVEHHEREVEAVRIHQIGTVGGPWRHRVVRFG